jgi:hypothetical protein
VTLQIKGHIVLALPNLSHQIRKTPYPRFALKHYDFVDLWMHANYLRARRFYNPCDVRAWYMAFNRINEVQPPHNIT